MAIQANKRKRRDTVSYWLKEAARLAVNIGVSVFETKTGIDITPGCDDSDCPKNAKKKPAAKKPRAKKAPAEKKPKATDTTSASNATKGA